MKVRIHGARKGGSLILAARTAQKLIDDDLAIGEMRLIEYENGAAFECVRRFSGVTVYQTSEGRMNTATNTPPNETMEKM